MNKKTIINILLALVAVAGQAQTTDTLTVGMELKVQNVIGTNVFMYKCQTPESEFKGLPTDTASFRLYEQGGIVCILAREASRRIPTSARLT